MGCGQPDLPRAGTQREVCDGYDVSLYDKDGTLIDAETTFATSWTTTEPLIPAASPYHWSVVARDSKGNRSPLYGYNTFTYEARPRVLSR